MKNTVVTGFLLMGFVSGCAKVNTAATGAASGEVPACGDFLITKSVPTDPDDPLQGVFLDMSDDDARTRQGCVQIPPAYRFPVTDVDGQMVTLEWIRQIHIVTKVSKGVYSKVSYVCAYKEADCAGDRYLTAFGATGVSLTKDESKMGVFEDNKITLLDTGDLVMENPLAENQHISKMSAPEDDDVVQEWLLGIFNSDDVYFRELFDYGNDADNYSDEDVLSELSGYLVSQSDYIDTPEDHAQGIWTRIK